MGPQRYCSKPMKNKTFALRIFIIILVVCLIAFFVAKLLGVEWATIPWAICLFLVCSFGLAQQISKRKFHVGDCNPENRKDC